MIDAFEQSETDRRAQDGGRVRRAWRWFSRSSIEAGERYRDLAWPVVARHGVLALVLAALSRLDPGHPVAPWALIVGALWLAWTVRVAALKALDAAARQR